jgi:hypothetical protein
MCKRLAGVRCHVFFCHALEFATAGVAQMQRMRETVTSATNALPHTAQASSFPSRKSRDSSPAWA